MDSKLQDKISSGIAAQLTLVFVILKLAHQIDWGWGWVLTPLWIYIALTVAYGFIGGFVLAFDRARNKSQHH